MTIIIFVKFLLEPEKETTYITDCPAEYCIWQESDCKCIYNTVDKCYCQIYNDWIDCHLNCSLPDYLPERLTIIFQFIIALSWGRLISLIITPIIRYIIRTIKLRKIFWEKWEKKRHALIPIRNVHINNKLTKKEGKTTK